MSPTAPGNAELMRAIEALRTDVRDLGSRLEAGYVRKDVYIADQNANAIQSQGIEAEVHNINRSLHDTNQRITSLSEQRDTERNDRDRQRSADRRLILSVGFASLAGPLLFAWLSHILGLH